MACEYVWRDYGSGEEAERPCQFPASTPIIAWQGRPYCLWHLPHSAKYNWSEEDNKRFASCLESHLATIAEGAEADFRGVVFPSEISFNEITLNNANFRDTTFAGGASFYKSRFDNLSDFRSAKFLKYVSFHESTFCAATLFGDAKFSGGLSLSNAVFEDLANFARARIQGEAYLDATRFKSSLILERAELHGQVSFTNATIEHGWFDRCSFSSGVSFSGSIFNALTSFIDTKFSEGAEFDAVTFNDEVQFYSTRPETARFPYSTWKGARFTNNASFNNRIFATHADFSETVFDKAPTYHGCALHEAMLFPHERNFRERSGLRASQAYRTLRLAMEKMSAHLEAGKFYALEQESRRNTQNEMKHYERLLSLLYGAISDYGRNALRPLGIVLAITLCLAPIYALAHSAPLSIATTTDSDLLMNGLNFSFQQVVAPFGLWRERRSVFLFTDTVIPTWVIWTAMAHSLISIILVSLSLLAIRWRFKRY